MAAGLGHSTTVESCAGLLIKCPLLYNTGGDLRYAQRSCMHGGKISNARTHLHHTFASLADVWTRLHAITMKRGVGEIK